MDRALVTRKGFGHTGPAADRITTLDKYPSMNAPVAVALWMAGAIASFTLMGVAGRELSTEMDTFGILLVRGIVGLLVVLVLLHINGWHHAKTTRPLTHLFRNLVHYGGQFGWFYGIALLPLAQVFALEFTVPLWGLLLAVVALGEKLTMPRIVALVLGLVGVLVILRPGVVPLTGAVLAVLGSAVCYAIAHISTKSLISTDSPLNIIFYMTLLQLPIGIATAWRTIEMPSPALWPWVIIVGLTALSAHYCLARALARGDASMVLPLDFLRLPVIAIVAAALYAESIDIFLFAGAALMIIGNLISLRAERGAKNE